MPSDTGAPFFLPYPEDTDLVRDGASDIEALADATATAIAAAGSDDASDLTTGTLANARLAAGTIIQVVQGIRTTMFTSASTSFVDIGLSATITPSATSSKVLVLVSVANGHTFTAITRFNLLRASTNIYQGTGGVSFNASFSPAVSTGQFNMHSFSLMFLDSPATTAARTYKVQVATTDGVATVNRRGADAIVSSASSITLFEVKA